MRVEWLKTLLERWFDDSDNLESSVILGGIAGVIGALWGAIYGWLILPPETLNLFQLMTAILGLVVGGALGVVAGILAAMALVVFWAAVGVGLVLLVIYWLFSS